MKECYVLENAAGICVRFFSQMGHYTITCEGEAWLKTGIVGVRLKGELYLSQTFRGYKHRFDSQQDYRRDEELHLEAVHEEMGGDALGVYDKLALDWSVVGTDIRFTTSFLLYRDKPALVFEQYFPDGYPNYANGDWRHPTVSFPMYAFSNRSLDKNLFMWRCGGMFNHTQAYGFVSSISGEVDILMFAKPTGKAMVLSPFANFLAATQQSMPLRIHANSKSSSYLSCGIEGLAEELPAGFTHRHILVYGAGINNVFAQWGQMLLAKSGKVSLGKYHDDTLKYITYWDDYGAYYCQRNFEDPDYANYEEILLAVEEDAKRNGIHIGAYAVLDLDQLTYDSGTYELRPDLFPSTLPEFSKKLGKPIQSYIAWLFKNGPYREKYPYFDCITDGYVPAYFMGDVFYSREYWQYTAEKLVQWGCIFLQHDFLCTYEGDSVMMSGINNMDMYFKNMAAALEEKNISMQYCMQLSRNILESTENPTVLSLQGTLDHHAEPTKDGWNNEYEYFSWKHLIFQNIVYGNLGLWPARDNVQPLADPNAFEDILLSNLSAGPVEIGNKVGELNPPLLAHTFREGDGLLLKPDRPITAVDRCFYEMGVLGYTETRCGGDRWVYVLSLPPCGFMHRLYPKDIAMDRPCVLYNWKTGCIRFLDTNGVALDRGVKSEYFVAAPVLDNGMALIGDASKFITMADARVPGVACADGKLTVSVLSSEGFNPIISGYSPYEPAGVWADGTELDRCNSIGRLENSTSGWYWEEYTGLWHVRLDYAGMIDMAEKSFTIE